MPSRARGIFCGFLTRSSSTMSRGRTNGKSPVWVWEYWGFWFVFPVGIWLNIHQQFIFSLTQFNRSGFFCVCFPRKFMGLKEKVYFVDWFGCWVYWFSGFGCFARDLGLVLCWVIVKLFIFYLFIWVMSLWGSFVLDSRCWVVFFFFFAIEYEFIYLFIDGCLLDLGLYSCCSCSRHT